MLALLLLMMMSLNQCLAGKEGRREGGIEERKEGGMGREAKGREGKGKGGERAGKQTG